MTVSLALQTLKRALQTEDMTVSLDLAFLPYASHSLSFCLRALSPSPSHPPSLLSLTSLLHPSLLMTRFWDMPLCLVRSVSHTDCLFLHTFLHVFKSRVCLSVPLWLAHSVWNTFSSCLHICHICRHICLHVYRTCLSACVPIGISVFTPPPPSIFPSLSPPLCFSLPLSPPTASPLSPSPSPSAPVTAS